MYVFITFRGVVIFVQSSLIKTDGSPSAFLLEVLRTCLTQKRILKRWILVAWGVDPCMGVNMSGR
jgi:hypothetical protein